MEQRRDIENTKPACQLILASASPRRRELLERIGLKPEIHPSTLEENPLCTEPAQVVMELAGQKARDVMAQVREEAERQWKCGNLVRVYADIQGERLAFGQSAH